MKEYLNVLEYLTDSLRAVFEIMDVEILKRINEIRLRRSAPVIVVIKNTSYFIDYNGDLYDTPNDHCVLMTPEELETVFMAMCAYSLHSVMDGLKKGYITLPSGARVGVAASAVYEDNRLIAVKDVTSLNIRIPREVSGCSDALLNFLYVNSFPSIIVAGKPNSGKTTLLRDMARNLSGGFNNRFVKLAVIDERNELAGKENDHLTLDLGINTDVLTSFSKAEGIELATRSLSPEMIICDEVSTDQEVSSILYAFSSGIRFALSVHLSSREDLLMKPIIKTLLTTGEFSYIVLLDDYTYRYEIIDAAEVYDEISRGHFGGDGNNGDRNSAVGKFQK